MPRPLCAFILAVLTLLPVATLFHRNDAGRWTANHEVMAAPDEPAYLLMARSLAAGHGVATTPQYADRNAFYPPGFPLLLAAWGKMFGDSITSLHACVVALMCATVPLAYWLLRGFLGAAAGAASASITRQPPPGPDLPDSPRRRVPPHAWLPLLLTAVYVANWHVLNTALYIFSEPAFMLAVLAWLLLACRWGRWPESSAQTAAIMLLAIAAHLIRGAGLVCIVATLGYAFCGVAHAWRGRNAGAAAARDGANPPALRRRIVALMVAAALGAAYFAALRRTLPPAPNSYAAQLLRGLTDGGRVPLTFSHAPGLCLHIGHLALLSAFDFLCTFVPELRTEDLAHPTAFELPRLLTHLAVAGVIFLLVLCGFAARLRRGGVEASAPAADGRASRLPEVFFALYAALYLVWPFHGFTRFWIPILPLALAYAGISLRRAGGKHSNSRALWLGLAFLLLLAGLYGQELWLQLPYRQRRLDYVSDSLAAAAAQIRRLSPDPAATLVAVPSGEESFLFAWYLGFPVHAPRPGARLVNGAPRDERIESLLLRLMTDLQAPRPAGSPQPRLFFVDYFTHGPQGENLVSEVFTGLHAEHPELFPAFPDPAVALRGVTEVPPTQPTQWRLVQRHQQEIITSTWEIIPPPVSAATPAAP